MHRDQPVLLRNSFSRLEFELYQGERSVSSGKNAIRRHEGRQGAASKMLADRA